jgi:hypothetical protein
MDADPELPMYKTLLEMPQLVPEIGPTSPPEVEMVKCCAVAIVLIKKNNITLLIFIFINLFEFILCF